MASSSTFVFVVIGTLLIIIGSSLCYFSGVSLEHTVAALSTTISAETYRVDIIMAVALVVIGGIMIILGIQES